MTFAEAIQSGFSNYANFYGRAARSEFWWWTLFVMLVMVGAHLIDGFVIAPLLGLPSFSPADGAPLSAILSLALLLPGLAMAVRRLHDTGRSGWWVLIGLIPLLGALVLIYFYVQPSSVSENKYAT
ncbi:DUF805 domain-containing protein [Rhodobacteraceae bacterium RKSG542]|uniref:DUF805 domain-containing protein n=1 Tax=Pseudovibrio flavus TaxID=2529854 RepID=UPI0035270082|nr:DUF805 domain-containing protein [Pseudovibrio flavus]